MPKPLLLAWKERMSCLAVAAAVLLSQDAFITYADYAARARVRIAEIAAEQASVAATSIKGPDQTATVSDVSCRAGVVVVNSDCGFNQW